MGKIHLLDCTLRDGGYINDWKFGVDTIKGFGKKIARTGIEMYEIGFLKGSTLDPDRSVFPTIESIAPMITPKAEHMKYLCMLDMSAPTPLEEIPPYDGTSVDGIRVIFKKEKLDEAFAYCKRIKELGYMLFVNFVGTDLYTDKEFIEAIEKYNTLMPYSMAIVDTFGRTKRKQFLRFVYLADHNMAPGITLCYHGHNNLQQAFSNAESLVEMNLKRDVCIDACVFGMGRGAGNLNLEVFAEYMNDNYDTEYRIEPMLEIMDEYLTDIYRHKFWGYSLPLYLSATLNAHPNYAIYLASKDSLTVKAFGELLRGIPENEKTVFSKERAERIYREYQENYIDDKETVARLSSEFAGRPVLLLAPGRSLAKHSQRIRAVIRERCPIIMSLNFDAKQFSPDYVFSSNMRRFAKIQGKTDAKCIVTSNMKECEQKDYVVNFSSYTSDMPELLDNSGLIALRLLAAIGVTEVMIAGMDGYSANPLLDYTKESLTFEFVDVCEHRNELISAELAKISKALNLSFITPTLYTI